MSSYQLSARQQKTRFARVEYMWLGSMVQAALALLDKPAVAPIPYEPGVAPTSPLLA
jgi:hypothetical protein